MKTRFIILLALTAICTACSPKSSEPAATEQPPQPASQAQEKPAGVIPEAQQQALEKAKQTDDMVIEATEKRMKEAE